MSNFQIVKLLNPISLNIAINPRGAYDNGTTYQVGDLVTYGGASYIAITTTTGNLPTDAAYWQVAPAGPPGPTGPTGPQGDPGADGKTILNGSGVPSSGLGVDGDFYIDTTADTIYGPKATGVWGSSTSIVGPAGATGATGPAGADSTVPGPAGADGLGVPAGGLTGQSLVKVSNADNDTTWSTITSGGGAESFSVTDVAHGHTLLQPMYWTGSAWALAKADSDATLGTHVIIEVTDADHYKLASSGRFTDLNTSSLTAGTYYFVSAATAGTLTSTAPTKSNPILQCETSHATTGKILVVGWRASEAITTLDHTALSNIGTNTHAQIDTALTRLANTSGTNTGDQTSVTGNSGTTDAAKGLKTATTTVVIDSATAPTSGQVLTASSTTAASWVTPAAAGMTNPMTTGGDVIYGGSSGTPTRLANGTAGQVLQSNGTTLAPTWVTPSGSANPYLRTSWHPLALASITSMGSGIISRMYAVTSAYSGLATKYGVTSSGASIASATQSGSVLLPDGKVFICPFTTTALKIYNPISDTVKTMNSVTVSNQTYGGLLMLDGRVYMPPYGTTTARIYDPVSDTISTPTGTFAAVYQYNALVMLDGKIYFPPQGHTLARVYDPIANTLTDKSLTYTANTYNGTVLLPNGKIFLIGASGTYTPYIYDPALDTQVAAGGTWTDCTATNVLLPSNKILCFYGSGSDKWFKTYDIATDTLSAASSYQLTSTGVGYIVGLLPDGNVLCTPTTSETSYKIYDPINDTLVTSVASGLSAAQLHIRPLCLPDGRVILSKTAGATTAGMQYIMGNYNYYKTFGSDDLLGPYINKAGN